MAPARLCFNARAPRRRAGGAWALAGCWLLCTVALADGGSVSTPAIPKGKGEACVEPVEVMRRYHMDMLDHQRDATVHGGIRGAKHSLKGCIDCHAQADASGNAIPINASGQFCESCHRFAAVTIDCFSCHATVPAKAAAKLFGWGISLQAAARPQESKR